MGYRINNDKPPKPEEQLPRYEVRNGATMVRRFECYYFNPKETHSPHYHDFLGYPAPNYHHDSCQMQPPREVDPRMPDPVLRTSEDLTPINLTDEGYTSAVVVFDDDENSQYLDASAWFDSDYGYVVNMSVKANFPTFEDEPKEMWFTLFVGISGESTINYDAVARGIVVILPGAAYTPVVEGD